MPGQDRSRGCEYQWWHLEQHLSITGKHHTFNYYQNSYTAMFCGRKPWTVFSFNPRIQAVKIHCPVWGRFSRILQLRYRCKNIYCKLLTPIYSLTPAWSKFSLINFITIIFSLAFNFMTLHSLMQLLFIFARSKPINDVILCIIWHVRDVVQNLNPKSDPLSGSTR